MGGWNITLTSLDLAYTATATTPDPEAIYTTEAESSCAYFSNVPYGQYSVSEEMQTGWKFDYIDKWNPETENWDLLDSDETSYSATIEIVEETVVLSFNNQEILSQVLMCKVDATDEETLLSGWEFTLSAVNGEYTFTDLTAEEDDQDQIKGCITTEVPYGDYTILETPRANWTLQEVKGWYSDNGEEFTEQEVDSLEHGGQWSIDSRLEVIALYNLYQAPSEETPDNPVNPPQDSNPTVNQPPAQPPAQPPQLVAQGIQGVTDETEETGEDEEVLGEADPCDATSSLSGYVFEDLNSNGKKDKKEKGLVSVTVKIFAFDDNGRRQLITTTKTNKDGYWQVDICAGAYEAEMSTNDVPKGKKLRNEQNVLAASVRANSDQEEINFVIVSSTKEQPWARFWWLLLVLLIAIVGLVMWWLKKNQED